MRKTTGKGRVWKSELDERKHLTCNDRRSWFKRALRRADRRLNKRTLED